MTTLLPLIAPDPFNTHLERKIYTNHSSADLFSTPSSKPAGSLTNLHKRQQFPPISQRSVATVSAAQNDENRSPVSTPTAVSTTVPSVVESKVSCFDSKIQTIQGSTCRTCNLQVPKVPNIKEQWSGGNSNSSRTQRVLFQLSRPSKHRCQNDTPTKAKQKGQVMVEGTRSDNSTSVSPVVEWKNHCLEPFPTMDDGLAMEASNELLNKATPGVKCDFSFNTPHLHDGHRQRPSNASSRFVHTIKTASMSNASFSIVPRSLRIGRSSESNGCLRGYSRHSLDSDRPAIDSSLDDAALRRGLKRKQIINELILTEESYVADLKALVYLYSTLLVSTTTISDHVRTAIQRNITDLLHTHETLLDNLRKATYEAAARKWADTETPTRLELTHRLRRKTAGSCGPDRVDKKHRRTRSSIDSAEISKAHVIGAAEPVDVLDLAHILSNSLAQFFAYEEYCANHEIIAQELQKHLPDRWSTYESGMESLARMLVALDRRKHHQKKGLTVGDLLIKPIQRVCRYPLLLEDLLKHTPVVDGPAAHKALDAVLDRYRDIVRNINIAANNDDARLQVQRKWMLRDRLILNIAALSPETFCTLGSLQLCGVLYLTYQNTHLDVVGNYIVCSLFDNHFLMAMPEKDSSKLNPVALISLSDLRIEASSTGNGLRAISSLYTWKITFTAESGLYGILLSACSKPEEDEWVCALQGQYRPPRVLELATLFDQSKMFWDVNSLGTTFRPFTPFAQQSPTQHAPGLNDHRFACQVIVRNTYNPQDWQEFKNSAPLNIGKPRALAAISQVTVLTPKRTERTRLETSLANVYTKERLPFPGMIGSKGSHTIRASAGSLVRKLSFASVRASFSKRSASLSSKKSYHTIHTVPKDPPTFSVRKQSGVENTPSRHGRPKELPELDTMDSVIERMIGAGTGRKRLSFSNGEKLVRRNTRSGARQTPICRIGPEDPATMFYRENCQVKAVEHDLEEVVRQGENCALEQGLGGPKKKRWSNPISKWKGIGGDRIMNILYSSK